MSCKYKVCMQSPRYDAWQEVVPNMLPCRIWRLLFSKNLPNASLIKGNFTRHFWWFKLYAHLYGPLHWRRNSGASGDEITNCRRRQRDCVENFTHGRDLKHIVGALWGAGEGYWVQWFEAQLSLKRFANFASWRKVESYERHEWISELSLSFRWNNF